MPQRRAGADVPGDVRPLGAQHPVRLCTEVAHGHRRAARHDVQPGVDLGSPIVVRAGERQVQRVPDDLQAGVLGTLADGHQLVGRAPEAGHRRPQLDHHATWPARHGADVGRRADGQDRVASIRWSRRRREDERGEVVGHRLELVHAADGHGVGQLGDDRHQGPSPEAVPVALHHRDQPGQRRDRPGDLGAPRCRGRP